MPPKPKQTAAQAAEIARLREFYKKNGHIPTLLSNESRSRFGDVSSTLVSNLGRDVALGKISRSEAQRRVRQGDAVTDPDARRAGLDVSAELDPKINSAARRRKLAREALDQDLAAQRENVGRTNTSDQTNTTANSAKVAAIYQQLVQQMQQNTPQIASLYDQQAQGIQANTASLQEQIKTAYQQANAATQAQVAGMGGGTTQGQAQGAQDQAFLSSIAGIQGQSQLGLTNAAKTGGLGIQTAGIVGTGREGADRSAQMIAEMLARVTGRNQNLSEFETEARQDWRQEDTELGGSIADLEETRFARLYENKQKLAEARAQAAAEAEQTAFERQLAQSKLGVDLAELDIKRGNQAIDQQRVDILAQETNAKLKREQNKYVPGTPEYEEIQAAIDLKRAQAASTLTNAQTGRINASNNAADKNIDNQLARDRLNLDTAKANRPPVAKGSASSFGKGAGGAQKYIPAATGNPGWQREMQRLLGVLAERNYRTPGEGRAAMERSIKNNGYPPQIAAALRRMTDIYYGSGS